MDERRVPPPLPGRLTDAHPGQLAMARAMLGAGRRSAGWRGTAAAALFLGAVGAARTGLALDTWLTPDLASIPVERPVFVLGLARSGTTMLHRLLAQSGEACVFRAWELSLPSLVQRRLVAPFLRRASPGRPYLALFPDESHPMAWDAVEEEEILLALRLDSQMLFPLSPLAFHEDDPPGLMIHDLAPAAWREDSMALLKGCFQRQIRATGRPRVVAKMPYSTTRVRTLRAAFPDARFVYLVRSPLETVPSHLSMLDTMLRRIHGDRVPDAARRRFWDRRYRFNVAAYRYFEDVLSSGDLGEDVLVVRYPDLVADVAGTFERVVGFTGLEASPSLRATVAREAVVQARRSRPHTVRPPEAFGIPRERILEDLRVVFDRYGFARDA